MNPISDRTLAQLLVHRLAELQLFHLFARKLGPRQPVHLSAHGFTDAGEVFHVHGEAETLDDALLELFAAAEVARHRAWPVAASAAPRRPSKPPVWDPPQVMATSEEHRRRVALQMATRLGSVTARALIEATSSPQTDAELRWITGILDGLVAERALRRSPGLGYVLATKPEDA